MHCEGVNAAAFLLVLFARYEQWTGFKGKLKERKKNNTLSMWETFDTIDKHYID